MEIRRLTTDEGLPVSLEALKLDLRVDGGGDDDDTIVRMAQTAAGMIERRSGYILLPGTFEVLFDLFDDWKVSRGPLREVVSISIMTDANVWTDQDLAGFRIIESSRGFEVCTFPETSMPQCFTSRAGARLRFYGGVDVAQEESDSESSGDGDHPLDPLVRGVYIALVSHLYANRELFEADKLTEIESTAGGLLNSIRQFY